MNIPVFDLHCDTALALMGDDMRQEGSLRKNSQHISLERASRLPGYCQCFACFTTPGMGDDQGVPVEEVFQREMEGVLREVSRNQDLIVLAKTPSEIENNLNHGKMSAVLTIEGPAGFGFDPARLEGLWNHGFRISTLGWNEKNVLSGSNQTGGELTDLGREYVREAQRLGMLIDVSHLSDEGFWDIMDMTEAPVIATHSDSRAVRNVPRNLSDDMFREICQTGGVAGINLYTDFLGDHANLDTVCDHVFHYLELDPDGRHVALGGDLDGCESIPEGMTGVDGYNALAERLNARGLDPDLIHRIFWDNALGVMKRCCM